MHKYQLSFFLFPLLFLSAPPAAAYIGPGAGAGTIAVVVGILVSIVMAFFAILWYPAKRVLKRWKVKRDGAGISETSNSS